jgi:hypothetical protein
MRRLNVLFYENGKRIATAFDVLEPGQIPGFMRSILQPRDFCSSSGLAWSLYSSSIESVFQGAVHGGAPFDSPFRLEPILERLPHELAD